MQHDARRDDGDRRRDPDLRGLSRKPVSQSIAEIVEAPDTADSELTHQLALSARRRRPEKHTGRPERAQDQE